ncbi:MAG: hypothetical protein H6628_13125 [Calditrichae bacterium]|nr:hypothetical protein [Calditrichia bacterium]
MAGKLYAQEDAAYRYSLKQNGETLLLTAQEIGNKTGITLPASLEGGASGDQLHVLVEAQRPGGDWHQPVSVYLQWDGEGKEFRLMGVRR